MLLGSACGGGGGGGGEDDGGDDGIIGTGVIRGTAATGDPIANAGIAIKSNTGKTFSAQTDATGKFEIGSLPSGSFLMRIDKGNGDFLYSIAHSDGKSAVVRNTHPYTDLIIKNWFQTRGLDINSIFTNSSTPAQMPEPAEIDAIKKEIHAIVAQVLQSHGVGEDVDLFSTPFDADGTGFDKFILNNPVIINNNQITVIVNDIDLNIEGVAIDAIDLNTDFTSTEDSAPNMPGDVRALAASTSEIIVVWEPSTDDKGVTGYNVYRNGEQVATTPYPVYRDSGLSAGTEYYYEIEAIDGRGQVSVKSTATAAIALDTPDTTAPPAPTGLQVTATGDDAALSWSQEQIDDVYGFRVLRGGTGNVTAEIANITATTYTDFNLASSTRFCYKVVAYDAAGNESAPSEEGCTTTGGAAPQPSSVSLSAATYTVTENATSITITVNRSGDISEAISVDYTVDSGTATAGTDFSAASGTLSWTANDSSPKTFTVQITSDSATEGDETVQITLSNPSANTVLGQHPTAVLTITDFVAGVCNGEITNSRITEDTTLSEPCYKVPNGIRVENPAKLTISPGVRLEFAAGTKLQVSQGASLYAVGTSEKRIIFTAQQATPGYWEGVEFYSSNSIDNQLDYVTVEYGVINIDTVSYSFSPVRLGIKNTTSRYASDLGMYLHDSNIQLDVFENNILTLNERPISLPAEMVGLLGADSSYAGNTDDRIHVFDEDIVTAQTWAKLDAPYYMLSQSTYDVDAALTLEAGVLLTFNSGAMLGVSSSGSLKAIGTETEPVVFTGLEQTPGYWKGIQFLSSNSINNQLDYVTVEYGVINIDTVSFPSSPVRLGVKNTTSRYASNLGMYLYSGSIQLDAFENNVLTQNGRPISLPADMVRVLGRDSIYTGNTDDRIHVFEEDIVTAQTWAKLDAPYYLSSTTVYDIDAALVLDAGVSLAFNSGSGFNVNSSGSLKAIGTEAEPVLFTGFEQIPGYWEGIRFYRSNSINNQLDYVTVEYAGAGNPSDSANIFLLCSSSRPVHLSVTNSTIKDSFGWGVYKYGDEARGCNITLSGNTYSNNASGDVNIP